MVFWEITCPDARNLYFRIVFEINPENGDKRGSKKKKVTVDPKLAKLANLLANFNNLFSVET
jgi:hypothetical protein